MREISSYISKQEAGRDCRTCLLPDTGCVLDASFSFQQHFHSVGKHKEERCSQPRDSYLAHPRTRPHPFLCNLQSVASALLCMLSMGSCFAWVLYAILALFTGLSWAVCVSLRLDWNWACLLFKISFSVSVQKNLPLPACLKLQALPCYKAAAVSLPHGRGY